MECSTRTFSYSMTTNGLLLHKYMDYLAEHKFNILISLDGDEYNTSYRVDKRGKPAFDTIIRNVDSIKEKHPDYFEKYINFNAVLHNRNSVESIHTYFKQKYGKMPRIGEISNSGIRKDKVAEFGKAYRNSGESLNQAEHYSEIVKDMGLQLGTYQSVAAYLLMYSDFVYSDYNELLYGRENVEKQLPTGTCIPFSKKVFMTVNNKLLPCERIGHQFALGKVSEDRVELDFEHIAHKYNTYYSKVDNQCRTCHNKRACIQCIYNLSDIDAEKTICYGYMSKKAFDAYQNAQLAFLANNPETYTRLMEDIIS